MNDTTRELIEREIAKEERGRQWAAESIAHFQRELKQAEAKRDAHAEKIGALKESLAPSKAKGYAFRHVDPWAYLTGAGPSEVNFP